MKRVIRLTESELNAVIKKVISEAPISPLAKPGTPPPPLEPKTLSLNRPEVKFSNVPEKKFTEAQKTIFGIGDRGPKIKEFQKHLVALGYNVGNKGPDGIFGEYTQRAVQLFQKENGIKISGRVGPPTMKKLADEVNKRTQNDKRSQNVDMSTPEFLSKSSQNKIQPKTPQTTEKKSKGNFISKNYEIPSNVKKPLKSVGDWISKNYEIPNLKK